jgi:hypothetical protein
LIDGATTWSRNAFWGQLGLIEHACDARTSSRPTDCVGVGKRGGRSSRGLLRLRTWDSHRSWDPLVVERSTTRDPVGPLLCGRSPLTLRRRPGRTPCRVGGVATGAGGLWKPLADAHPVALAPKHGQRETGANPDADTGPVRPGGCRSLPPRQPERRAQEEAAKWSSRSWPPVGAPPSRAGPTNHRRWAASRAPAARSRTGQAHGHFLTRPPVGVSPTHHGCGSESPNGAIATRARPLESRSLSIHLLSEET